MVDANATGPSDNAVNITIMAIGAVKPSEKINPKFVTYLVETTDGRVLTGLLVKKTDQRVILRDAQNKLIELPASQVEFLVPQPKSLMPDLLFKDMSAQQLADLLAYLEDLK